MNEILKIIKQFNDDGELINIPVLNVIMKKNVESEINKFITDGQINYEDVFDDGEKYLFVRK